MGKTFRTNRKDNEGKTGTPPKKCRQESRKKLKGITTVEEAEADETSFTPSWKGRGLTQNEE